MTNSSRVAEMAQEIRENPAQFLHEALKTSGFLADAEFKPYAEAGKPFIMRLEEACLPYLEIDYFRQMQAGGVMLNQLVASPHVPHGETEPQWSLNAHYQTIYHDGVPWSVITEGEISDMARAAWEQDGASILARRGTRKDSWIFPEGIRKRTEHEEKILHASNY